MKEGVLGFIFLALVTALWACDGKSADETHATLVRQLTLRLNATEKRLRIVQHRQRVDARRLEEAEKRLAVLAGYYLSMERNLDNYIAARKGERQQLHELERIVLSLRHAMVEKDDGMARCKLELCNMTRVSDCRFRRFCMASYGDLDGNQMSPLATCNRAVQMQALRSLNEKVGDIAQFVIVIDRRLGEFHRAINGKLLVLSAELRGLRQTIRMPSQKRY